MNRKINTFAQNIKNLRRERRLTQKELGNLCQISAQGISRYETGLAEPDIEMIKKFSDVFKIDYNRLFENNSKSYLKLKSTKDKNEFSDLFNQLSDENKRIVIKIIKSLVEEKDSGNLLNEK